MIRTSEMIIRRLPWLAACVPACILFLGGVAWGQFESLQAGQSALDKGNRLQAVKLIEKATKQTPELESLRFQFLPVISDYRIEVPFEKAPAPKPNDKQYVDQLGAVIGNAKRLDGLQTIANIAKQHQIVILNEAHDTPQHRAVAMQLAKLLADQGFEYLAVETLQLPFGRAGLVNMKYPRLSTGSYSREPVFGDFLRQAVKQGYQLVAYEIEQQQRVLNHDDRFASIIAREQAQADNLIKSVLKQRPDARIFIYVGYSHATENWRTLEDGREVGWLAAQLQRKTGIDPLTIDQVGGTYNIKTGELDAAYQLIHQQAPFDRPTVIQLEDGTWATSDRYHESVDLTLFLPVQQYVDGRPDWLAMEGYRQPIKIRNSDYYQDQPTLLQAFVAGESSDAIPVDQILILSAQGESTLLLPAEEYRLMTQIEDGTTVEAGTIQVSADDQLNATPADGKMQLVEVKKIWDQAPHNAFTDLIRFQDQWWCVFREGLRHVSDDGSLRVISSNDGKTWKSRALIEAKDSDLRDAKLSVTPNGKLMLMGAEAIAATESTDRQHQSLVWFSSDGDQWSDRFPVGVVNNWLWRVTWHDGKAYGFGYDTHQGERGIRLFSSADGKKFETLVQRVPDLGTYPNETSIVFDQQNRMVCLLRQDGEPSDGMVGVASPPYRDWAWKSVGRKIGGPDLIQLPDGRWVAAVRLYDSPVRTSLCWLDVESGELTEALKLPSGGDTSYAGLVWHDQQLWVSYYSSHEGKTSIYLAQVKIEPKPNSEMP